ncbi:MAG: NAD(P)/FAD-dependent oxidoreductase [Candidatus Acidiferrum sp.]
MFTENERTDVFVIGGGPAGLAVAIAACRRGFSVTVADGGEPPIDKACGEGLMPETQAALRELGVELPGSTGYHFRGIRFVQGNLHVAADLPEGQGIGIRRTVLHKLLIQEAERCGVKLLWKTPVAGIASNEVQVRGRTIPAQWIIGADGGSSRVRRWSGLNASVLSSYRMASRRHYRVRPWTEYMEIYWGPRQQAYVTAISREEVCIVVLGDSVENVDFDRALEAMPELRERLEGAELCSRERGAITEMHSLKRVWRGNVALVGDASGVVDAITGEGLRLAFRQAFALAEAMESGDLREYGLTHKQLARRPIRMGKLLLQLGRKEAVRLRALRMLSRNPELFARLLTIHVGWATPGEVFLTGAQLGWQFLAA